MQYPSQQFIDLGRQNLDTMMRFTNLSLQGATRIFKAQTEAAKEVYAENAKTLKATLDNGGNVDPGQTLGVYRAAMEKSWDLTRDCIEAATQTQSELSQMFSEQLSRLNDGVSRNLDQLTQYTQRAAEEAQKTAQSIGDETQRTAQRASETAKKR